MKQTKIKRSDLQVYPSERLTDNNDGGGMPIGTALTGAENELFPPVSQIERINGAFKTRLVYAGVRRNDDEPLLGSYHAITKPPADPYVSYLLFKATHFGEVREQIANRIESYNVGTIESTITLMSIQTQNSNIVRGYQRTEEPLPIVGTRYQLKQDKAGYPKHEQYIQVTKIESEIRTFYDKATNKEFKRLVVKLEITKPLAHDFVGVDYPDQGYADAPCKLIETHVANAAKYFGVKPLAQEISKAVAKLKVSSIFEKIIPTSQIETPLTDLDASGKSNPLFDSAKAGDDGLVTVSINATSSDSTDYYLGNAVTPGSVLIKTTSTDITDAGGALMKDGAPIGTIDYAASKVRFLANNNYYISVIKFRPAVSESRVADTARSDISIENQSLNHVMTIDPPPAPGTLVVRYRSQGKRYDLRDFGNGRLTGASPAHGSGNVNFVTGTVTVTCGELPDVGSSILYSWGNKGRYFNRAGATTSAKMILQLAGDAEPSTLNLSWNDGAAKTATCDTNGDITGDWTGKYDVATRQIAIDTDAGFNHPAGTLDIDVAYSEGSKKVMSFTAPNRSPDGTITLDLGTKPIKPGTFKMIWNVLIEDYNADINADFERSWVDPYITVRDDGNGQLVDKAGVNYGTIDYANHSATFNPDTTVSIPKTVYKKVPLGVRTEKITAANLLPSESNADIGKDRQVPLYRNIFDKFIYVPAAATFPIDLSGKVDVAFYDNDPATAKTEQLKSGTIEIDLLVNYAENIAPHSLNFVWGGKQYFDRGGIIYTDLDAKNSSATLAGNVDYAAQKATLTLWNYINGDAPNIIALATSVKGNPVDAVTFATPSAPIRPSSLQVRAVAMDGTKVSAIADANSVLDSQYIKGKIDVEYGMCDIRFGELVVAAGNESEEWYNADAVDGNGKIWKPKHVIAETITYSTVAYSYLPVNSTVVKIDTVRLPQDGKVPIYRVGDTILITNSKKDDIGSAHTAGATVNLSRQDVDRICVSDAKKQPINAELWDYDLDAGTITWKTPLDLSGYTMPISVTHTRQEINRIRAVDIDGTLDLIFPTKRDYEVSDTYISSVVIGGDLQVRHSVPFTQRNWNNVWQDTPVGTSPLNKLNLTDYPMILTDDGAITEKWLIKFTATNTFELYSERLGFVATGDTLVDLAPVNPATQKPYFVIKREAFGNQAPWAVQDVIRFNTWGTLLPLWVISAVQPTQTRQKGTDGFTQCIFGDTTEV